VNRWNNQRESTAADDEDKEFDFSALDIEESEDAFLDELEEL